MQFINKRVKVRFWHFFFLLYFYFSADKYTKLRVGFVFQNSYIEGSESVTIKQRNFSLASTSRKHLRTKAIPDLQLTHSETGKSGAGIKTIKSGNFSIKSYVVAISSPRRF